MPFYTSHLVTQITSPFPAENYSHGKRFLNLLTFYWPLSAWGSTLFPAVLKAPSPAFNPWRLTGMNRAGGGPGGCGRREAGGGGAGRPNLYFCSAVPSGQSSQVLAEGNEHTPNLLLNMKHLFSHGSVARKSRIMVLARPCSLGRALSFLGVACSPGCVMAHDSVTECLPLSSHGHLSVSLASTLNPV